jgi:5'-deoxy-5'-methylthioadenosine phosphorylase
VSDVYAVIGGSGLYALDENFRAESSKKIKTPYGDISSDLIVGEFNGCRTIFLTRHGASHHIPPHKINYRANLWALNAMEVSHIIAINAVGGIDHGPRSLVLPDQIIDYTSGRCHTFSDAAELDGEKPEVNHIDFSFPYSQPLRENIIRASRAQGIDLNTSGTYGCTNGPRLETIAEIRKMQNDGCNIIGMTGMPEAALARELEIEYASIALVVNWCAGIESSILDMDTIRQELKLGMTSVIQLIRATMEQAP